MSVFQSIGGFSAFQPEIVTYGEVTTYPGGENVLFAFAVGQDSALWYSRLDGQSNSQPPTWSEWSSLGGVLTSPPNAVQSAEFSIDVFAAGENSELLHWQFTNGAWVTWPVSVVLEPFAASPDFIPPPRPEVYFESLGGILTSPPRAAVEFAPDFVKTVVCARGTDSSLWMKVRVGDEWQDWTSIEPGFVLASAPSPVFTEPQSDTVPKTFAVFALGADSAIWYTLGAEWQTLQGEFSSEPYAVTSKNEVVHVFAADAQRVLNHRSFDGNTWTAWQKLDGLLMSSPTAISWMFADMLEVYALGTDSAIWHNGFDGNAWNGWQSLGGPFLTPPATAQRGDLPNIADLIALGVDHTLHFCELSYEPA